MEEQPDISFTEELVVLGLEEDLPLKVVLMIVVEQVRPLYLRNNMEIRVCGVVD